MAAAKAKSDPSQVLRIDKQDGRTDEQQLAALTLSPAANTAATVLKFSEGTFGKSPLTETFDALQNAIAEVKAGDLSGPEALLVGQAHSLNLIFTELARRSALNMGEYIQASERYMRLALKAQAQCRATVETLAALKNPPLVIARQANISNGPQQVNNGAPAARAANSNNQPIEQLEHHVEQRLDPGATGTTGSSNPELVPVEALDRA